MRWSHIWIGILEALDEFFDGLMFEEILYEDGGLAG